jgi:hypothetical protein
MTDNKQHADPNESMARTRLRDEEFARASAAVAGARPGFRILATTMLDWPQLDFVLKEGANDFASKDDVPAAVRPKLVGFIRSGHLRFYDLTPSHTGGQPVEVTPTVPPIREDGKPPVDVDPFTLKPGTPNANKPSPGAPIPQNVASSEGYTGDGTPVRGHDGAHDDKAVAKHK